MPDVVVDFECLYDGQLVRFKAGRDWVAPGHEIVRRHPGRFGLVRGRKHPARSHMASVVRHASPYPELAVELRDVAPSFEVDLAYSVRPAIEEEIRHVVGQLGNVETGGFLFGHRQPRADLTSVRHASGPGSCSRHSAGGLKLASVRKVESEFSEIVAGAGLIPLGCWHSHPASPGRLPDPRPSPADLRGWTRQREALGLTRYVGLIVTPAEDDGWGTPDFHAFVSYRADDWYVGIDPADVRHLCEPAAICEV